MQKLIDLLNGFKALNNKTGELLRRVVGRLDHNTKESIGRTTGVVIPGYIYPADIMGEDPNNWNKLINLIRDHRGVETVVIINPDSGPGTAVLTDYRFLIRRLQSAGAKVIGYIPTHYIDGAEYQGIPLAPISLPEAKASMDKWQELYPDIDGIFIDEMTNDDDPVHSNFYAELTAYGHQQQLYPIFTNPGTTTYERYYRENCGDVIVMHEKSFFPTRQNLEGWNGGWWENSQAEFPANKQAVLVHSQYTLAKDKINEVRRFAGYIYVTDDRVDGGPDSDNYNPWDTYSGFMPELYKLLEQPITKPLSEKRIIRERDHQSKVSYIIPAYQAPAFDPYALYWTTVLRTITENPEINFYVIVNPSHGSGEFRELAWAETMDRITQAGGTPIAYMALGYTNLPWSNRVTNAPLFPAENGASVEQAKELIDKWVELYPEILEGGIMYDETPNIDSSEFNAYFKELRGHCGQKGLYPVIANPGVAVPRSYFDDDLADLFMIFEGGSLPTVEEVSNTWSTSWFGVSCLDIPRHKKGFFSYGLEYLNKDDLTPLIQHARVFCATNGGWADINAHLEKIVKWFSGKDALDDSTAQTVSGAKTFKNPLEIQETLKSSRQNRDYLVNYWSPYGDGFTTEADEKAYILLHESVAVADPVAREDYYIHGKIHLRRGSAVSGTSRKLWFEVNTGTAALETHGSLSSNDLTAKLCIVTVLEEDYLAIEFASAPQVIQPMFTGWASVQPESTMLELAAKADVTVQSYLTPETIKISSPLVVEELEIQKLEAKELIVHSTEFGNDGIEYDDPDAIGANPQAKIYPDGTVVGSTSKGTYVKYPNGIVDIVVHDYAQFFEVFSDYQGFRSETYERGINDVPVVYIAKLDIHGRADDIRWWLSLCDYGGLNYAWQVKSNVEETGSSPVRIFIKGRWK